MKAFKIVIKVAWYGLLIFLFAVSVILIHESDSPHHNLQYVVFPEFEKAADNHYFNEFQKFIEDTREDKRIWIRIDFSDQHIKEIVSEFNELCDNVNVAIHALKFVCVCLFISVFYLIIKLSEARDKLIVNESAHLEQNRPIEETR